MIGQAGLTLLVLFAALLHAGWNTVVKTGLRGHGETGEHRYLTPALVVGTASVAGLALTTVAVPPAPASWGWLGASVAIHTAYFTFLVLGYRAGDLGQVYPIARGTGPLIVALLSGWAAGESLSPLQVSGVAVISGGVLTLAAGQGVPRGAELRAVALALATGTMIAAYTLVDALGIRAAGSALGYIAWLNFLMGLPFAIPVFVLSGRKAFPVLRAGWRPGVGGGLMTMLAYGLVLWAFTLGAVAPIAALRETSVVFAAAIGAFFLGEPFGRLRVIAAALVAAGVLLLSLPG